MQKFKTKVLSVLLTLCMLAGMLQPMGALVAEAAEATNVAQGKTVTTDAPFVNGDMPLANIVDGNVSTGNSNVNYGEFGADGQGATDGKYYVQIDLEDVYDISKVQLYRYFNDNRVYDATVIALAENETDFGTEAQKIVYNSDADNVHGLGEGTDEKYAEKGDGAAWEFEAVAARYVRLYMCGVQDGGKNNHVVECMVYGVKHEEPTEPEPTVDKTALNEKIAEAEGLTESDYTAESWSNLQTAIAEAKAIVEKEDATAEEVETQLTALEAAIAALKKDETTEPTEPDAGGNEDGNYEYKNIAQGKAVTAALNVNQTTGTLQTGADSNDRPLTMAVDGIINTNNYADIAIKDGSTEIKGSAYVQVDFGQAYDVDKVNLYRYFNDGRTYDATVIVLAENETDFGTDAQKIVYNSDTENVHGLGAGTDAKYAESASGKEVTFHAFAAQYIRVYVNGNDNKTANTNHIVELQAWAKEEVLPEPEPAFKNAKTYLDFPTHYQEKSSNYDKDGKQLHVGGQVVHPDVVYVEGGWNGYEYWCVYTPNTMVTSQYENPYIAASHDGKTWVEPSGIKNPIEPEPVNTNLHNCDADMVYNKEMNAMMAYWNWANDNNWSEAPLGAEVRVRISYDGIHWGVPSTYDEETGIWTKPANESERTLKPATTDKWGLDNSFITAVASRDRYDMLSPTFTYDSYRDVYVMWANNAGNVGYNNGQNNHVDIRWSKDGLSWSEATPVNNFLDKTAEGQSLAPWHQDVNYIPELKEYWAFSQCFTGSNPDGSMLYLTRSKDGINWEQIGTAAAMNPGKPGSWDDFQIYRTCFVYKEGAESKVEVWYSSLQQDTANKQIIDSKGDYTITAGPQDTRIWRIGYTENTYEGIMTALTGNGEKPALVTGTALDLTAEKTELPVGEKTKVTAAITPADTSDQIVKYTSSNEEVAEVTPFGEVIAVGEGTATITAETRDNISDTVEITVKEAQGPVVPAGEEWYDVPFDGGDIIYEGNWGQDSLGKNTYERDASATLVFYGTGIKWVGQTDSNFGTALVTIDDNEPVEVSTYGVAATNVEHFTKDLNKGVHTIKIQPKSQGTSDKGVIDINKFVVRYDKTWDIKVSSVTAQASADAIRVGKTATVSAYVQPFNAVNKTVTFESENPEIASVSKKGVVTGIAAGTATIKVIANGAEAKLDITVTDGSLPAKRIEISNEKPLLIVPVYGQAYKASGSELQWGDTLLGRWNSIPEDIKDNVVMEIHCMRAGGQAKAFYEQQLEIAQANNIPVMIVTANGGSAQFRGEDGAAWLDNAMKTYDCLKGFIITENYWTDYNGVATEAANHLRVAAENGGYLVWYEHKAGVMESILTNAAFRPAVEEFGSNLAFTWKNTPVEQNAATASYMQGLWLEGVIDQWGGLMDSWKWWELGYAELFNPKTSLTGGGIGRGHIGQNADGDGEETRACVMEPEAMLGIEMMSIYANGGAIYSFEHPAYTQGVEDQNTPAFENVIYDTFKYIMKNPAPSKEEVMKDTELMIHGNTSSNPNIFTNVTMKNQALPTYFTGQYGLIPSVPSSITVDDMAADKVVEFSEVDEAEKLKNALSGKYADSAYEGDAFAQKVENSWILYNSIYNESDTDQTATVTAGTQSVKAEMEPHTYAIMKQDGEVISVYLNNYRVVKDEIWEGYGSTTMKWDPDVNHLMEDWVKGNYIKNTKDGKDTYRTTTFTLTGLKETPTVNVLREKENDFAVDVAYENGTAVITVKSNGYVEFTVDPNGDGDVGNVTEKDQLAEIIKKAEEATKAPENGTIEFEKDSKAAYDKAKAEADRVYAAAEATQEEIDAAAEALEKAVKELSGFRVVTDADAQILEEAKGQLPKTDYVIESKNIHQFRIEKIGDYNKFPVDVKLPVPSLTKGDHIFVLHKENDTKWMQMKVKEANVEEQYVVCTFYNFSPVITATGSLADTSAAKKELKAAIDAAKKLKENNYTASTWAKLEDAVKNAENILTDEHATNSEVLDAIRAIADAINGLKAVDKEKPSDTTENSGSKDPSGSADKNELEKVIQKAEKLNKSDYTWSSWSRLEDALKAAKQVYKDKGATQGEVDKAVALLNAAFNTLHAEGAVSAPVSTAPTKTGDSANIALMIALLGIAVAGSAGVLYKKKRS